MGTSSPNPGNWSLEIYRGLCWVVLARLSPPQVTTWADLGFKSWSFLSSVFPRVSNLDQIDSKQEDWPAVFKFLYQSNLLLLPKTWFSCSLTQCWVGMIPLNRFQYIVWAHFASLPINCWSTTRPTNNSKYMENKANDNNEFPLGDNKGLETQHNWLNSEYSSSVSVFPGISAKLHYSLQEIIR